ncbi:MAG: hypothetical protein KME06_04575 [Kastovskya adunca ATA6-11-RM4]|jgi:hypothetical protein|nr:hypothetical protein [Kastovskya adunca ATA6-11-RM4]
MIQFGKNPSEPGQKSWRRQLDQFVKENQQDLAALSWGLWLENGDSQGSIGIDIEPTPRFIYCPKAAIEKLNHQAEDTLREMLGVIDAHNPELEVLLIGISSGQINLVQFKPEPAPPVCFEEVGRDVDTLLTQLEESLSKHLTSV